MEQAFAPRDAYDADAAPPAPFFSLRTVWLTAAIVAVAFVAIIVGHLTDRSELLMPIDPNLHAAAIGTGVFAGILLDAVFLAAQRRTTGYRLVIALAMIPVLSAISMSYAARRLVEYRAFGGLPVVTVPMTFTVTGVHSSRSGRSLMLVGAPGQRSISLSITNAVYFAAHPGEHIVLPVQTGRGGVQRMIPPPIGIMPGDLLP
jgi:hypothetical protein